MLSIERRIAALEASASDDSMEIIAAANDETQTAALKRVGLQLGALRVVFIISLDARL